MSQFDRCILSFGLLLGCLLALREGDYFARARAQRLPIVVSVSGAVVRPGVVRLPADGRAVHAIELSGGLTASADSEAVELARPLADGEHLMVPRKAVVSSKQVADVESHLRVSPISGSGDVPTLVPEASARVPRPRPADVQGATAVPVDVNRASALEFESLPGVGPVMAERIVQARQASPGGTFGSLEELRAIRGIKAKTFLRLKPYLKIEGP